jgi:hypothetical protein
LTRVFHDELTFRAWVAEQPAGRVLVPARDSAWVRNWKDEEEKTPTRPVRIAAALDPRLPPRAVVVGVELEGRSMAFPLDRVLAQAPLHSRVGSIPIVLLAAGDGRSVRVYEARIGGRPIELVRLVDGGPEAWADGGTGSRWNFRGEATAGPLKGGRLRPVYALKDYWFDWKTYHPNTGLYSLGGR